MRDLAARLLEARPLVRDRSVVVLPDFFLDHFVTLSDESTFQDRFKEIHARGGGNLITGPQSLRLGGNAANTAYALGRLGVLTTFVTRTDPFGAEVIQRTFRDLPIDTTLMHVGGRTSATVALEFGSDGANVMLSDPGPLADLGPEDLEADGELWDRVMDVDAVAITNWGQMRKGGTRVVCEVAARAHRGRAFTFLDTGDPTHRSAEDLRSLLNAAADHIDVWGMNENELRHVAHGIDPLVDDLEHAARVVRTRFPGRIDVHTATSVFSLGGSGAIHAPTFEVQPLRLTGSGDAWNAGNLLGSMLDLPGADRLVLANAVAACTITSPDARPPTLDDVAQLIASAARRQERADRA